MDLPGALVDGRNGVRVGNRKVSGDDMRQTCLDVANGLDLAEPRLGVVL